MAQNPETARRWAKQLEGTVAGIWLAAATVPEEVEIELLVTDLLSAQEATERSSRAIGAAGSEPSARSVGVVCIGPADWGDVNLSQDCAAGELRLACTLLGEITRLRVERAQTARIHHEIKQLAYTDPLTGLPNRRTWDFQLPLKCRLAESGRQPLWLAIVDLDRFKQVNDACGLSIGDGVLAGAAGALAGQLRRDDLIARLGGDEFGVLLSDIGETDAQRVFGRLREAVARQPVPSGVGRLSLSIGYATPASGKESAAEMFVAAEQGLRQAKLAGGDRAVRGELGQG